MKTALWLFIVAVAIADICFTAYCPEAELNPIAWRILRLGGIPAVAAYRASWVLIAILASRMNARLSQYVLPVWFGGHMVLLAVLLECFWAFRI